MSSDDQENLERIDEFARELDSSNAKTPRSFSLRYGSNTPKGEIEGAEPIRKTSARHSVDDKIIDESPTFSKTRKVIVTTGFICATIALLIGSVFYSYSTSSAEYRYLKSSALASLQWPSTTGTITKSKLNYEYDWYTQHAVPYYDPDIAFEYSVKGKSYDGHKI